MRLRTDHYVPCRLSYGSVLTGVAKYQYSYAAFTSAERLATIAIKSVPDLRPVWKVTSVEKTGRAEETRARRHNTETIG